MTLFFYGALELNNDRQTQTDKLLKLAAELGWKLDLENLLVEYTMQDLFGIPDDRANQFLVFELKGGSDEVDQNLYRNYGGDEMVVRYRQVARTLDIDNWESLEFGSSEVVDQAYRASPEDLPVITFLRTLFEKIPDREIVICIDEGFENRFDCREVIGDPEVLLREAWMTTAFGYSWPNLRLRYLPQQLGS